MARKMTTATAQKSPVPATELAVAQEGGLTPAPASLAPASAPRRERASARRAWAAVHPDNRGIATYLRLPLFLAERMGSAGGGVAWRADYDPETDSLLLTESDSRDPRGRYLGQLGAQATLGCPEALGEAATVAPLQGEAVPVEWDTERTGYRVWIRRPDLSLSGRGISPTDRPMIPATPKRGGLSFPTLLEWGALWEIATGEELDYSEGSILRDDKAEDETSPRPPMDAIIAVCASVEQFLEFVRARRGVLSRRLSQEQADAKLVSLGRWPQK